MGQLEDMALFIKIVENGSITATAGHLNIAKSAVSRRLMDLEIRLGVQLLNRTTRKSSLTEAGQLFYQKAQAIVSDAEDLTNLVSSGSAELRGTLKVAVPLSFGLLHLSPAVNKFSDMHPDLLIDLHFADRQIDLVEEGFDLAIRIAQLEDSSLVARRITTIRHTLCASPDYLLKRGIPETAEDLKHHDILKYSSPTGLSHQISDKQGVFHEIQGNVVMMANNGDFLKQAALAGRGIYFTPTFISWREFKNGSLVPILKDYEYMDLGAYTVYPQTRFLSERVRQFIDFLSVRFGQEPYWDNWIS
ncbi:MAG: LysR family transcriptional regulator [Sneathiella sp.]|nr:LysR family transcriptional regulator [Sneathiella sp.]